MGLLVLMVVVVAGRVLVTVAVAVDMCLVTKSLGKEDL